MHAVTLIAPTRAMKLPGGIKLTQAVEPARASTPLKTCSSDKLIEASKTVKKRRSIHPSLTCLFCCNNPRYGQTQHFARSDGLRKHYHFAHFQHTVRSFLCPVEHCDTIIDDPNLFSNYAVTVHKSDLGPRVCILKTREWTTKLGQLVPFR